MRDTPCQWITPSDLDAKELWGGTAGGIATSLGLMKILGPAGFALGGPPGALIGIAIAGTGGTFIGFRSGMKDPVRGVVRAILNAKGIFWG
jgi:hypothetical protein